MPAPITADEIEDRVSKALNRLKEDDLYLLENDLNECSINHRLAVNSKNGL